MILGHEAEDEELETLDLTITRAYEMGAIIVAAAGNDSAPTLDEPNKTAQEMQIPASHEKVYGVMATNTKGERSCYSNKGDVSAPGGQGGRVTVEKSDGTTEEQPCESRASTWNTNLDPCPDNDIANCEYGLISLGQTRYGPQYMLWSGTSFAAPLVSGLAALAYEEREQKQVECMIGRGVSPLVGTSADPHNLGIINITKSLSNAVLSTC